MDKNELFFRRRVLSETVRQLSALVEAFRDNEPKAEAFAREGVRVAKRLSDVQDQIETAGYE